MPEHGFYHIGGKSHIVVQVSKGNFGLNHPKFGGVARGVGLLCAEGGSEGVYLGECQSHTLCFKLTGNGETCVFAEEIPAEIYAAVLTKGRLFGIECGNAEHFACTLAVAAGDDGCVGIDKAAGMEKVVDRKSGLGAHTESSVVGVCAGTEVCNGAQKFCGVALFLKRIIGSGESLSFNSGGLKLKGLFCLGGEDKLSGDYDCGANVELNYLFVIGNGFRIQNHLQIFKSGAVVELDEAEHFGVADGFYPAANGNCFI